MESSASQDSALREAVAKVCREVLSPLVRADGGVLYLVEVESEDVHVHLSGTCAGCPGAGLTREKVIEPAVRSVAPKAKVRVTTGWRVPPGAEQIG